MRSLQDKVLSLEEAVQLADNIKQKGALVTTNGCFDLLHKGHVCYLAEARRRGSGLIVGVNTDESVRKLKGPTRPVNTLKDRLIVLAALESVDAVFPFDEETPVAWLEKIKPTIHVKGADYAGKDLPEKIVARWGGQLEFISFEEGYSTTQTIANLQ